MYALVFHQLVCLVGGGLGFVFDDMILDSFAGFCFFLGGGLCLSGFVVVRVVLLFVGFSMESLILAQDERWRRA